MNRCMHAKLLLNHGIILGKSSLQEHINLANVYSFFCLKPLHCGVSLLCLYSIAGLSEF